LTRDTAKLRRESPLPHERDKRRLDDDENKAEDWERWNKDLDDRTQGVKEDL